MNTPSVTIRPADTAHFRFCAESRYEVFRFDADYTDRRDEFINETEAYFLSHVADEDIYTVIAFNEKTPIGCGTLIVEKRLPHVKYYDYRKGYIVNVFVQPEYRGKGIAKQIMHALHTKAREMNLSSIELDSAEEAKSLYISLGYRKNEYAYELKLFTKE